MATNVSVQYKSGLLPDIILLTQGYYCEVTITYSFHPRGS